MKKAIFKALNIEKAEQNRVLLLLAQSFFIGIFLATFDISSSTLFMDVFGKAMLPKAFLVSGAAGLLLTTIYSRLQSRISFSNLAVINLITITLITCATRYSFEITDSRWLVFVMFVLAGPLTVLAMLGFWGVASRLFTLREGKKLFGMIDAGQIFGIIVISFSIPIILPLFSGTKDLLFISAFSIIVSLLIQLVITRRYNSVASLKEVSVKESAQSAKFKVILKNPLIVMMSLFVILSMVGAFFINYSFLAVIAENYPDNKDLASFLGIFTGIVMIFSFLFKTFVYSKLMQTYGLRVSLLILPLLLIVFSAIAALVGVFFGYTAEAPNFAIFFLLICLTKLFSQSLRSSIEIPAFKTLYQPLDKSIRYSVQAKIDGVVNEFSALSAGIIITVLGVLEFFKTIHFTFFLVVILAAWIFVILKVYNEYKLTLKNSLDKYTSAGQLQAKNDNEVSSVLKEELTNAGSSPDKMVSVLTFTKEIEPILFESTIVKLLENDSTLLREFALRKIEELKIHSATGDIRKQIKNETSSTIKKIANDVMISLGEIEQVFSPAQIEKLAKSKNSNERKQAAQLMERYTQDVFTHLHIELIKDIVPEVRIAAITAAAKSVNDELLPFLMEFLSSPKYNSAAAAALVALGEPVIEKLDQAFYKSGFSSSTLARIINIYGLIGGEKAKEFLASKITYPDIQVVAQVLLSLKSCGYQSASNTTHHIFQSIESTIRNISWNIAAQTEIGTESSNIHIAKALEEEIKKNYDLLYLLLSLVYDPLSIKPIRENIESGTSEGIGYAIELLDLFLAEELKPKLFPLLEDIPTADKMLRLQVYFPRENLNSVEVLKHIINRDYNDINRWTKACAIYALGKLNNAKVSDDLVANLFNPSTLLAETAAFVINKIDPEKYQQCRPRIEAKVRENLHESIKEASVNKSNLLIERILFLKEIKEFESVPGVVLAEVAKFLKTVNILKNTPFAAKNNEMDLYVILKGSATMKNENGTMASYGEKELIGEMLILHSDRNSTEIIAAEDSILYKIEKENLLELMFQYTDFAEAVINSVNVRIDSLVGV